MAISEEETTPSLQAPEFGDIFPHVENILHCGFYSHPLQTGNCHWSDGLFKILAVIPGTMPCSMETLLSFVEADERDHVQSQFAAVQFDQGPFQFEFSIKDAEGKFKRLCTQRISTTKQFETTRFEGIIKDITESYQIREALELKVKQLDKSNQNLQEFVYIASHDLQEPLRKISTFIGRLDHRFQNDLPEDGRNYLTRILNATHNMQRLLEDLLAFSRLSFEEKAVEIVSLNDSLKLALSDLEIKIEESGAKITYTELPTVLGHPHQLKQLFLNLLSNALKFRKTDTLPEIRIDVKSMRNPVLPDSTKLIGEYFKITVEDNGIGFEQVFAEKIFTIFQRLNGKSEYAGSGIGLAICRKIIEQHGGKIHASSEVGKGAHFSILLPNKFPG